MKNTMNKKDRYETIRAGNIIVAQVRKIVDNFVDNNFIRVYYEYKAAREKEKADLSNKPLLPIGPPFLLESYCITTPELITTKEYGCNKG